MVKEIRIYIEGDTKQKGKNTDITLRQGFNYFFRTLIDVAKNKNITIRPITYGSKYETFKKFLDGVNEYQDSFVLFLLDSDAEISETETPRSFLKKQNPTWHLQHADEEQCHLMVQVMESWFFADKDKLAEFYGQGFNLNALAANPNIEKIAKTDVETGLANATKKTQKGEYHKTGHGAKLLELIDPQKVRASAPNCDRFFRTILDQLAKA